MPILRSFLIGLAFGFQFISWIRFRGLLQYPILLEPTLSISWCSRNRTLDCSSHPKLQALLEYGSRGVFSGTVIPVNQSQPTWLQTQRPSRVIWGPSYGHTTAWDLAVSSGLGNGLEKQRRSPLLFLEENPCIKRQAKGFEFVKGLDNISIELFENFPELDDLESAC